MLVGFYHPFYGNKNTDISLVFNGNPGYGGTQFCFSILIYQLAVLYKDLNIIVYSDTKLTLPNGCICKIVSNEKELLSEAKKDNVQFLILKTPNDLKFYEINSKYKVPLICWAHNYFNAHISKILTNSNWVKSIVFVGKQMYDFYYDDDVIEKSTFIYNAVPDRPCDAERKYKPFTAVYMGSIIRQKGIIELMKLWKIVEEKYPQAELNIIGTGKLYNKNSKLGPMGLADEKLEKELYPYLCGVDGKKNIHMLGLMGEKKYKIFSESAVGIVNPSAKTETFGMGIIEMNSVGLPVVTKGWNGHLDTIINGKTGLTAFTIRGIAKQLIRLFEDDELNTRLGKAAKERVKLYSPNKIARQWHDLFFSLDSNSYRFKKLTLSKPYWNNYKFIRKSNAFFRQSLKLKFLPSIVQVETFINDGIKNI